MSDIYDIAGQEFLLNSTNWASSDLRMIMLASDYIFDKAEQDGSDMVGKDVAIEAMGFRTASVEGKARSQSTLFTAVSDPRMVNAIGIIRWSGSLSASIPIVYLDDIDGLPFVPDGKDYRILNDVVFRGLFKLSGSPCP